MENIEISNNTIIKLLCRRGTDAERREITLHEGELGYTVDTKRLFIGDGITGGGIVVGSTFLGSYTDPTSITFAATNDLLYDSDDGLIRRLQSGDGSLITHWETIGGPGSTWIDDQTIQNSAGTLSVKTISSAQIHNNVIGTGIEKSGEEVRVKAVLTLDEIQKRDTNDSEYLAIPQKIRFKNSGGYNVDYTFPLGGMANGYHLTTDITGELRWAPGDVTADTLFVSTEIVPVGTIMPYLSTTPPDGWLLCNGQSVLSATYSDLFTVIGTEFGTAAASSFNLPDYTRKTLYGYGVGDTVNSTLQMITSTDASSYGTGLSADPTYWVVKWRADTISTAKVTTQDGLTAYNQTVSASTTTIDLSGEYAIGIDGGDEGTGNVNVVAGVNRARRLRVDSYTIPGVYSYEVRSEVYQLKVICTGGGGVGFRSGTEYGYNGGAGATIISYLSVVPGQIMKIEVGAAGTTAGAPASATTVSLSSHALTATDSIFTFISAGGARDDSLRSIAGRTGGWAGGLPVIYHDGTPGLNSTITTFLTTNGGDGGYDSYVDNEQNIPGASSYWGSAPSPGGGGGGEGRGTSTEKVAPAHGVCIIETM